MPDIQLSEEMKERLKKAGVVAYQLKNTWKYVPRAYRETKDKDGKTMEAIPKEHWPVFTLRCLDGVSASLLEDKLNTKIELVKDGNTSMTLNSGRVRLETCSKGIVGVKNFLDTNGKEVKVEKDKVHGGITEDSLKHFSPTLQVELTNVITEQTTLTEDELLGLG